MPTIEIEEFPVCIAHQLHMQYESKCRHLHGHNYRIKVVVFADHLNKDGMVVDFTLVKTVIRRLDHATIGTIYDVNGESRIFSKHILEIEPSTAENLAQWLFLEIGKVFNYVENVPKVVSVSCAETESTVAIYIGNRS